MIYGPDDGPISIMPVHLLDSHLCARLNEGLDAFLLCNYASPPEQSE